MGKTADALRELALRHPDVEQGVACKGTALESTTFGTRKKVFLFLGTVPGGHRLRLRLRESVAEAKKLASRDAKGYVIGPQGWTKLTFDEHDPPPMDLLARWIEESYQVATSLGRRR